MLETAGCIPILFAGHQMRGQLAHIGKFGVYIDGLRQQGHDQTLQPQIRSTGIFFPKPLQNAFDILYPNLE
eukprot:scaffold39174_cov30-Attheya_sp.AAC.2